MSAPLDAIVVVPPLSPSDTNLPLGPYILRAAYEGAGLSLEVADLSIAYINRFRGCRKSRCDSVLGDQDKDRGVTHAAREHFIRNSPLSAEASLYAPCSCDPVLGMHYSREQIERAVLEAAKPGSFWNTFIGQSLDFDVRTPPRILGLSIMGPPQVFIALVTARLSKLVWPKTLVVAGGSHITLLINEIARDAQFGRDIDVFMPGHCEQEFVELASRLSAGREISDLGVRAGEGVARRAACADTLVQPTTFGKRRVSTPDFELLPSIDASTLASFDKDRVTLPMQLTRGCSYGRCTYCTYPAVERVVNTEPDWPAAASAIQTLVDRTGVRRVSFKDSLFTSRNLRTFANLALAERLGIEWSATTLLNRSLSRECLSLIASAGCRTLEVGLETTDPNGQRLFDKVMDLDMIEAVVSAAAECGIVMVLNQIFGWPGQSLNSANAQLDWYVRIRDRFPDHVRASFNLLEINRASPMAMSPDKFGIELRGIGPWAFSYDWNAPAWRPSFRYLLDVIAEQPSLALAA